MRRKIFSALVLFFLVGGICLAKNTLKLPEPKTVGKMSVEEAIFHRRSERSYYPQELSLDQIAQLLWAGQGISDKTWGFRTAPSSGALYPLNLYIVKKDGVFEYIPDGNKLIQIAEDDRRPQLVRASLGQAYIADAPLVVIVTGNFRITEAKYGQRAYRYLNMEIGHVAENIHLQAVAMGLVSVPIGAFWDDVVAKTLELPDTRDPFYIIPIGYHKPS